MSRNDKVNVELQRAIADIIRDEVDDPNLGMVSVVRVNCSPDLRNASVYCSVFPEEQLEHGIKSLNKMRSFIRGNLGRTVRLKYVPELYFKADAGIKHSVDIYEKIEELKDDSQSDS